MTFIITNKDGSRTQYSNHYEEDDENIPKEAERIYKKLVFFYIDAIF